MYSRMMKQAFVACLILSLSSPVQAGSSDWSCWDYVWAAGGAAAAVVAAPVAIGAAGFTGAGIAAGSLGASMMSGAATTGVGMGVVGALQSAGAAGMGAAAYAATAGAGAAAGKMVKKAVTNCDVGKKCD